MSPDLAAGPSWLTADPERLLVAGRTLGAVAEALDRMAATLDRGAHALDGDWQGQASEAFTAAWAGRRRELAAQAVSYRQAAGTLNSLAWALETSRRAHGRVAADAAAEGLVLLPDGAVTGPPPLVMLAGADLRRRAGTVDAEALAADQQAAGALHGLAARDVVARPDPTAAALPVLLQAGVAGVAPNLPVASVGLDPALVAAWFAALSPAERQRLLRTAPALLGNLDGVPLTVRDQANRQLVTVALAQTNSRLAAARQELAALRARHEPPGFALRSFAVEERRLLAEIAALEVRQGSLSYLSSLPQGHQDRPRDQRFILVFDPQGQGRAAVAVGDVATAADIGVLVPGTGSDLDDVNPLVGDAVQVHTSARNQFGKSAERTTAVVTWLGYDAPDDIFPNAIASHYAYAGAPALSGFVEGLRAGGTDPHITVVGHSYGSTLTGISAKQGLAADDVVFIGSPGVKAATTAEFDLPDGAMVWVGRSTDDEIWKVFPIDQGLHTMESAFNATTDALVGMVAPGVDVADVHPLPESHGPDPSLPGFGANRFGVDNSGDHSAYYKPDSESINNLATIIVGQGEVTRG